MSVSHFSGQLIMALALNLGLKVISFAVTVCLTRTLTPEQSGTYYLYDLYVFLVLFVVRGTVRGVALRYDPRERRYNCAHDAVQPGGAPGCSSGTCSTKSCVTQHVPDPDTPHASHQRSSTTSTCARATHSSVKDKQQLSPPPPPTQQQHSKLSEGQGLNVFALGLTSAQYQLHLSLFAIVLTVVVIVLLECTSVIPGLHLLPSLLHDARYVGGMQTSVADSAFNLPPLVMIWVSILLLAATEPCVLLMQSLGLFRAAVLADFILHTARTVALVILLPRGSVPVVHTESAKRAASSLRWVLGLSHLVSACLFACYYALLCGVSTRHSLPSNSSAAQDPPTCRSVHADGVHAPERSTALHTSRAAIAEAAVAPAGRIAARVLRTLARGIGGYGDLVRDVLRAPNAAPVPSAPLLSSSSQTARLGRGGDGADAAARMTTAPWFALPNVSCAQALLPFPWSLLSLSTAYKVWCREYALLRSFAKDSVLRLLLCESTSFAFTALATPSVSGFYQVVVRLGAILTRCLFQVWDEACFARWSGDAGNGQHRAAAARLLRTMRVSLYVSLMFVLGGVPLASDMLRLLYRDRWATEEAVHALQLFLAGLPVIGWNGLLMAFVRALTPPDALPRVQCFLLVQTILYTIACYVLLMLSCTESGVDRVCVRGTLACAVLLNTMSSCFSCVWAVYFVAQFRVVTTTITNTTAGMTTTARQSETAATAAAAPVSGMPSTPQPGEGNYSHTPAVRLIVASSVKLAAGPGENVSSQPLIDWDSLRDGVPAKLVSMLVLLLVLTLRQTPTLAGLTVTFILYAAFILIGDLEVRETVTAVARDRIRCVTACLSRLS